MTNRLLLCCALWVCGTLAAPPRPAPAADPLPTFTTAAAAGPDFQIQGEYVGQVGGRLPIAAQVIALGDGASVTYPLFKTYRSGAAAYARRITKPVQGTVRMGVQGDELQEGVHYEVDVSSGLVTFATPPLQDVEITAGFEFDVPVRFDTDRIATSVASFQAGEVPSVPVVEVRL